MKTLKANEIKKMENIAKEIAKTHKMTASYSRGRIYINKNVWIDLDTKDIGWLGSYSSYKNTTKFINTLTCVQDVYREIF
ncbi:MAG TPA: hypothetical protein VKA67_09870 [Verrucomicrobiae bacterium]|nr:hypothetical protein [Verrucomicrobiae bacterium]